MRSWTTTPAGPPGLRAGYMEPYGERSSTCNLYENGHPRRGRGRRGEARAHDGTIVWKMPEARAAAYCSIASVLVA